MAFLAWPTLQGQGNSIALERRNPPSHSIFLLLPPITTNHNKVNQLPETSILAIPFNESSQKERNTSWRWDIAKRQVIGFWFWDTQVRLLLGKGHSQENELSSESKYSLDSLLNGRSNSPKQRGNKQRRTEQETDDAHMEMKGKLYRHFKCVSAYVKH
ncbi:insulinase (Peptidase family M16) protein [Striga asiatica]|uniref:Insulinase (Peptidase family M16) protein n=1 Tax=Striga asiatica TaxID=4170 RepID=A0A5A7QMM5_STRAF|nr:insulinase (Peptidase family M16) protein [Striga asiatica]